jgi:hypothetical protein
MTAGYTVDGCTVLSEEEVLKQHQFFFQHVHWTITHNTLMKKIVTVMFSDTLRLKINLLLVSYYQALAFLHPNSSFKRNNNYNILI